MILLDSTANQPSITDWIEAVASILAIIASLWAFINLFRRDKEKEDKLNMFAKQTDSLHKLAIENSKQTKAMYEALAIEIERNRREQSSIQPYLEGETSIREFNSRHVLEIRNRGNGAAIIEKAKSAYHEDIEIVVSPNPFVRVLTGETFKLILSTKNGVPVVVCCIHIYFKDDAENQYRQMIDYDGSFISYSVTSGWGLK